MEYFYVIYNLFGYYIVSFSQSCTIVTTINNIIDLDISRYLTEFGYSLYFYKYKCLNVICKYIGMILRKVRDGTRYGKIANARCSKYSIVYSGSETSVGHISHAPTPMRHNKQTQKSTLRFYSETAWRLEKEERGT